jgi:regulator of sigma E protease
LDPTNNGPVNPEPNPPKPHDLAEAGPTNPATGQPDHTAEVSAVKSWFRENAVSLVLTVAAVAAVCTWFDPIDTLMVVVGLGFIIFIHELGHFVAAKWCDVHVRTFSIGFGPAVPFCSYKWGETTYMIGIIPLGGYVQMVGEGEAGEGEEEGEEDPRSFKKKSVGQRMLIISAGVVMNVIFGMACFVAAYLHGVKEKPATVGSIESGGAAWRSGMRSDDHIVRLANRENPTFDDLRPIVMSSDKGEQLPIAWTRGGQPMGGVVSPIRDEGQRFPQLGIAPPSRLELISGVKLKVPPYFPGTPAADAKGSDGRGFEPGDRVVAMSDPADPSRLTPVADYGDYHRRMVLLAREPVTFRVQRKDSDATAEVVVPPAFRHSLGVRMRMGEVVALREGGPAEGKVQARSEGPEPARGDRIKAVLLPPDAAGKRVWYVAGLDFAKFPKGGVDFSDPQFRTEDPGGVATLPLDPLLLPQQLNRWAGGNPANRTVELVVSRAAHPTDVPVRVPVTYDPSFRFDREQALLPNSPLPLSGLGLAYWVEAVIDDVTPGGPAAAAAAAAGELDTGLWHRLKRSVGLESAEVSPGGEPMPLQINDVITAVRFKAGAGGKLQAGAWKDDLQSRQWASADTVYQMNGPELDLRVKRGDNQTFTVTVKGVQDPEWGLDDRGLIFMPQEEVQKAADVGDAMRLGALRTVRFIKTVYMSLGGYIKGNISVKTLSGPLTIANVSYKLAGEDFWQFLLFLGMISVNLAVVNFLPIPVLDGGHMVFLILEKILGRPVPERMFAFAMYAGLFLILGLMVFVLFLDVRRLFFGAF